MKYDLLYCIGDSYVQGVRLGDDVGDIITEKSRFTGLVAANYSLPEVNKGSAGCSNEYIFRNIFLDMQEYREKNINPLVIVTYTDYVRKEMFSIGRGKPETITEFHFDREFAKHYLLNHYDAGFLKTTSIVQISMIKMMLNTWNIDFVDTWSMSYISDYDFDIPTKLETDIGTFCGYDDRFNMPGTGDKDSHNGHPTTNGHRRVAQWFVDKFDSLYNPNNT